MKNMGFEEFSFVLLSTWLYAHFVLPGNLSATVRGCVSI